MLKTSIAIKPKLSYAIALEVLYRKEQRADEELALLSQFETELTLESGLLLRLAELRADVGDKAGAIKALMRPQVVSASTPPIQNADARLFLAQLLAELGRSSEAVGWGKRWLLQWREPYLANRLLNSVVLQAPVADASELADAVAALHPEIRLFLVHGLATMGAKPVARHLLETWIEANSSPSANEIAAFLTACRDQDEPAIVWQTFGEVLSHSCSNDLIARYSEAIVAEFGIGSLAPFWASLPQGVIEQRPLLGARLATDSTAVIDLLGGLGGYTSVSKVLSAIKTDHAGGALLPLGSGHSIDFTGVAPAELHAANFLVG